MGEVYLAEDLTLPRQVAIKVITTSTAACMINEEIAQIQEIIV